MRLLTILLVVVLLATHKARGDGGPCPRVAYDEYCPHGCHHVSGGTNGDGTRPCRPVGKGHYSPSNDNQRYPCEFGTFSANETAGACSNCPAGTFSSSSRASHCEICPIGAYSNLPRSIFCSPCDPEHYDGEGANSIQVWNGRVYCALIQEETPTPTMAPTEGSKSPSATVEISASFAGSSFNETLVQLEATDEQLKSPEEGDGWCRTSEYEWHEECTECPSTLRTILHPIWMTSFVVAMILVLSVLPARSTTIVWMGVEYIQMVYFLGLVPSASSSPQNLVLLEHLHRWILSMFALDLDAGLSWQCLLGLSPALDQMFVLVFPMIVSCSVWILSQAIPAIHVSSIVAVGFSLAHLKIIVTSLEALHCSGSDWFCHEPLLSSIVGIIGLILYGCLLPLWLLSKRYPCSEPSEGNEWSRDLLAYRDSWWWPAFWMIRRTLLASLPVLLSEHPSWILTAFLVILMVSELIQRFASPFGDCEHQNRWFRTTTVDTILQASLIGLTGLKFLALAMPPETMRADGVVIETLFLAVWIPSVGHWIVALFYNYLQSRQLEGMQEVTNPDDAKSYTSASTSSSNQRKLCLPAPPSLQDIVTSMTSSSAPSVPPQQSGKDSEDRAIQHSLSLIPHSGPGDDLDIETVPADDEGRLSSQIPAVHYSEWTGTTDCDTRSALFSQPIHTPSSSHTDQVDFLPPSLQSVIDSITPPRSNLCYDYDDTSTLTDNNSYVPKIKPPHYHTVRPSPLDCSVFSDPDGVASLMESSGDGTPMIFTDDEDTPPPVEYHFPHQYHGGLDEEWGQNDVNDDDMTEVWIDEATGLPVVDKQSGEWADANTGLPVDSASSSSSSSSLSASSQSTLKNLDLLGRPRNPTGNNSPREGSIGAK